MLNLVFLTGYIVFRWVYCFDIRVHFDGLWVLSYWVLIGLLLDFLTAFVSCHA